MATPSSPADGDSAWLRSHPLTDRDRIVRDALRADAAPNKGKLQGVAARPVFDALTRRVAAPSGVDFHEDEIGGVRGWWCVPSQALPRATLLHLHGGWFTWGSAEAFRHLVGQIAVRAGVAAFAPDYRLAPEHAFPAGLEDARATYLALADSNRVAISGDSAGGGLALLVAMSRLPRPRAVVAFSPVTDLALTGASWDSRAEADPYFTRVQVGGLVDGYLAGHRADDPGVSPLYGELDELPPVRVHVGDDEVLLDDSRRLGERGSRMGADVQVDVWEGMAHGFAAGVGRLEAADAALSAVGAFLRDRLQP